MSSRPQKRTSSSSAKGGGGQRASGGKGKGGKGKGASGAKGGGARTGGSRGGKRPAEDPTAALASRLQKVLARLPKTQRDVLEYRMGLRDGHPHNLADTARALGLSMSEAKDIEQRAFEHIREAVPIEHLQKFLGAS